MWTVQVPTVPWLCATAHSSDAMCGKAAVTCLLTSTPCIQPATLPGHLTQLQCGLPLPYPLSTKVILETNVESSSMPLIHSAKTAAAAYPRTAVEQAPMQSKRPCEAATAAAPNCLHCKLLQLSCAFCSTCSPSHYPLQPCTRDANTSRTSCADSCITKIACCHRAAAHPCSTH